MNFSSTFRLEVEQKWPPAANNTKYQMNTEWAKKEKK